MDRITQTLLNEFVKSQELKSESLSKDFEKFCNYSVVATEHQDAFDIQDVNVGAGGDTGIDGIAIIANGHLIETTDEIDDLIQTNRYLDVTFIFIQAKTSSHFKGTDIGGFYFRS